MMPLTSDLGACCQGAGSTEQPDAPRSDHRRMAEMERRQATYAARRQRHTAAFLRGGQPEPPPDTGTEKRRGNSRGNSRFDL